MTRYATIDPTIGELVREFPIISDAEAEQALERAAEAYRGWSAADLAERTAVLSRMAELHRANAEELAGLMTLEMGKPIAQARGEVELSAKIYDYYADTGPQFLADEELDIAGSGRAVVRTAPTGPLLGIMPWNFPYYQVARFVAPNLLLGNTILLKHAGSCPQQALRIQELAEQAGAPGGAYQNIFANTEQVATMISDHRLRGVSLTGSERAGGVIGGLAGKHLKKCVLELGGSDPFLVLPGTDVQQAAQAAAAGRFANTGQACTSSKRIIVETSMWAEFLPAFLAEAAKWQVGDPRVEETKLGPMSSASAREELAEQVADAAYRGATIHIGGEVPDGDGAFYPATVLSGVTPAMRAYREELFGPAAVLHEAESVEAAVELANDSPYGLGSAVFARDEAAGEAIADRLDVGMVGIGTTVKTAPDLPFGGVKNSGVGRELGRFGVDEFANKKLIRFA